MATRNKWMSVDDVLKVIGWLSGVLIMFAPEIVCALALYLAWNWFVYALLETVFKISVALPLVAAFGLVFAISTMRSVFKK